MFVGVMFNLDTFINYFSQLLSIQFFEVDQMHILHLSLNFQRINPVGNYKLYGNLFPEDTPYIRKSSQ